MPPKGQITKAEKKNLHRRLKDLQYILESCTEKNKNDKLKLQDLYEFNLVVSRVSHDLLLATSDIIRRLEKERKEVK